MRTKLIAAAAILLASICGVFAQGTTKPKSTLNAEVLQQLPDNISNAITPANVRQVFYDSIASSQQAPQVNAQVGTSYTLQASDYGNLVTFNNASAVAVTLPQATGSFSPWNVYVRNLGAGTVTITPQGGSTINGAASFAVLPGVGMQIVSDGTNYQIASASAATNTLISVATYGATGNGSTNDAAAIQAAFNANPGRTFYFPKGTYLINSNITQPATPVSFIVDAGVTFTGTGQMPGAFTNTAQLQSNTYFYNAQTGGANNVGNTALGAEFIAPNSYIGNGVGAYFGASTPTSGTFNGFVWAINSVTNCNTNTGTYNCIGYELDFNNFSGVNGKGVALLIASASTFNPQYALEIARPSGTADWQTGIYVSKFQAGAIIDATGSVSPSFGLRLLGTYTNTGIDLSGGSFPTAFKSTGFSVDSSGNLLANNITTAWTAFTPTFTCASGTWTNNSARFKTIGKTTFAEIDATLGAAACTGAGGMTFALPNTANSTGSINGTEANSHLTVSCQFTNGSATATCFQNSGTVFAATARVLASGVYENQ
jgi:hypothetical protein